MTGVLQLLDNVKAGSKEVYSPVRLPAILIGGLQCLRQQVQKAARPKNQLREKFCMYGSMHLSDTSAQPGNGHSTIIKTGNRTGMIRTRSWCISWEKIISFSTASFSRSC